MALAEPPSAYAPRYRPRPSALGSAETLTGTTFFGGAAAPPSGGRTAHNWLPEVTGQIRELPLLQEGWDGEVALAVSWAAASDAVHVIEVLARSLATLRRPYVTPTQRGGVNLEWHCEFAHFDITLEHDGTYLYAWSRDVEWDGDMADAPVDAVEILVSQFA